MNSRKLYTTIVFFFILSCNIAHCQNFVCDDYPYLDFGFLNEEDGENIDQDISWPDIQQQMLLELQTIQEYKEAIEQSLASYVPSENLTTLQSMSQSFQNQLSELYEEIQQYSHFPEEGIDHIWANIKVTSERMKLAYQHLSDQEAV